MRLLVATTWFPNINSPAAGAFIAKDVAALAADHEVTVVHLVAPRLHDGGPAQIVQELNFPGIAPCTVRVLRVVMDPQRPSHFLRARKELLEAAQHADVIHTMAFSTLLPLMLGRRPRVPWVHTEHWSGVTARTHLSAVWRMIRPILIRALLRPEVVTTVSQYAAGPIAKLRGRRATVVVPCIAIAPGVVPPRQEREGDSIRLVSVGGMGPLKDPILAMRTICVLRRRGVDASLRWVGDGPLREEVGAELLALGLTEQVSLVGTLDAEGVVRELAACDLFFLPTKRETFGVAIAEALAHGRPVVVGAPGGQGEFISADAGALVATQEPAAYADAILDLDARTRDQSAEQIAATVRGKFTPAVVLAGYERVYTRALELWEEHGAKR